jgi:hypothetical protein
VISKRYEKRSVIITTNKNFESWGEIFADSILASAITDRSSMVVVKDNFFVQGFGIFETASYGMLVDFEAIKLHPFR